MCDTGVELWTVTSQRACHDTYTHIRSYVYVVHECMRRGTSATGTADRCRALVRWDSVSESAAGGQVAPTHPHLSPAARWNLQLYA